MHYLVGSTLVSGLLTASALNITALELPDCGLECYVDTELKVGIPQLEYKLYCLSGLFQLELRKCAWAKCGTTEYALVLDYCDRLIL
jgi:hypothetical protein